MITRALTRLFCNNRLFYRLKRTEINQSSTIQFCFWFPWFFLFLFFFIPNVYNKSPTLTKEAIDVFKNHVMEVLRTKWKQITTFYSLVTESFIFITVILKNAKKNSRIQFSYSITTGTFPMDCHLFAGAVSVRTLRALGRVAVGRATHASRLEWAEAKNNAAK